MIFPLPGKNPEAYAIIGIEHGENSINSCKKGQEVAKIITTEDSTKSYAIILTPGTWTITNTLDSTVKTKTINISHEGEVQTVFFSHPVNIFSNGVINTELTGEITATGLMHYKITNNKLLNLYADGGDGYQSGALEMANKIDITNYTKISLEIGDIGVTGQFYNTLQFRVFLGNQQLASLDLVTNRNTTASISLENLKGQGPLYFKFFIQTNAGHIDAYIKRIWFE